MRSLVLVFILFPFGCKAADSDTSTRLFNACSAFSKEPSETKEQFYCSGFIHGLLPTIYKVHSYYVAMFPNLTYPIKDGPTAQRYVETTILLGYDICLPNKLDIPVVAMILSNYGRDHPETLSTTEYNFATEALSVAFPCNKP